MDFELMAQSLPPLLKACLVTLKLLAAAGVVGLVLAVVVAVCRVSRKKWVMMPAYCYIYFFRGTPLLVQLFLVYYGLSQFVSIRESFLWPILREPYWCALIAFSLNTSAYTGEILRGAIQAVRPGQIEAARAMGMSRLLTFRRIIAPQAVIIALPGYANEIILLLKTTSLASTVTLLELTGATRNIIAVTYKPIELYLLAGIIYVALTFTFTRIFHWMELRITRFRRPQTA